MQALSQLSYSPELGRLDVVQWRAFYGAWAGVSSRNLLGTPTFFYNEINRLVINRWFLWLRAQFVVGLFQVFLFVFAKAAQGVDGVANAGAAHVWADDLHRVHHREAGGGAGYGDKHRGYGVFDFKAHLLGQGFQLGKQLVAPPGAQGFQAPEGKLQELFLLLYRQLVAGKAGFA